MKSAYRYSDFITGQEGMVDFPNLINLTLATLSGQSWQMMHLILFDINPRIKFDEDGDPFVILADLSAVFDAIEARITVYPAVCAN